VPSYLEFFAGGGMVRAGLGGRWKCQFANDFDPLKVQVYADNWGEAEILEDDIHKVEAEDLGRRVDLAWASFPCQDLSTAGNGLGIGQASGSNRKRPLPPRATALRCGQARTGLTMRGQQLRAMTELAQASSSTTWSDGLFTRRVRHRSRFRHLLSRRKSRLDHSHD
jgi:hypothetical protein